MVLALVAQASIRRRKCSPDLFRILTSPTPPSALEARPIVAIEKSLFYVLNLFSKRALSLSKDICVRSLLSLFKSSKIVLMSICILEFTLFRIAS